MSNTKSIKNFILLGILTAFFAMKVSNFAVAHFLLDEKCGVYFNYTQFVKSENETLSEQSKTFLTCINNTLYNVDRNMSKLELWDCQSRCFQISHGHVKSDGSFDPKFGDLIKERYKKYSNASISYINQVISVFVECATTANNTLKVLQANRTVTGECEINGIYEDCYLKQLLQKRKANTTEEACGTKLKR